jgi:hypothetical protein
MEKAIIIACLFALLLISGCAGRTDNKLADKANEKMQESAVQQAEAAAEKAEEEASQELVNFKCTIADLETIYFLKGDAKVESARGESWLTEDGFFSITEVNGQEYLLKMPAEQTTITYENMMQTYQMSKTLDTHDCEIGVVKEEDVTPPQDLEVITNEEMADIMMEGMANYGME